MEASLTVWQWMGVAVAIAVVVVGGVYFSTYRDWRRNHIERKENDQ